MKNILLVLFFFPFTVKVIGQQTKLKDLVGRWEIASGQNNGASLEVIDSSNIVLSYNGEKKRLTNYSIDFTKSPIWFDFSTDTGDSVVIVKTLIEIISDKLIKWQLFVDEERTPYFTSTKGELFFLRRAKATASTSVASN